MGLTTKIIIVDDQPSVLAGLRRSLWRSCKEWELAFCATAKEALAKLQEQHYDVIVADVRMPDMDGIALLASVRESYPHMVRIAFSGEMSQETLLQTCAGIAHQFLPKPCEPDRLRQTLARASSSRDVLASERLRRVVSRIESLPVLPVQHAHLMRMLNSETSSVAQIAAVISQDVGLSVKVLRLANSAYFGLAQPVWNVAQAVGFLGLDTMRAIAINVKIAEQFGRVDESGLSLDQLWSHSIEVAQHAQAIAEYEHAAGAVLAQCFLGGALHDVGKLVLASELGSLYKAILEESHGCAPLLHRAEQDWFGANHAQIGSFLLELWGFDAEVCQSVLYHHADAALGPAFTPAIAVWAADAIARNIEVQVEPEADMQRFAKWRQLAAPAARGAVQNHACGADI